MTSPIAQRLLHLAVWIGLALLSASLVIDALTIIDDGAIELLAIDLAFVPVTVVLAILGLAILRAQPGNPIGHLFSVEVLIAGAIGFVDSYAVTAATGVNGTRPAEEVFAWVAAWLWVPFVMGLLGILPLLLPNGTLLSLRWRWAERIVVFQIVALSLGLAFSEDKLDGTSIENPFGISTPGDIFVWLTWIGFILFLPCLVLGAVALGLRFRRSRGLERQQLKWLLLGAVVAALSFSASWMLGLAGLGQTWDIAVPVAITSVVLSTGLSVLRYRLYEIDRLISRTLVYASLSLVLGIAYVGLVLGGQWLFSSFAGGSNLAIAASTLVDAALFLPVRSRVQRFVDRRFYRSRYDVQRTLETFGGRLREQVELGALASDLRAVVTETMQPSHVSVWLRGGRAG